MILILKYALNAGDPGLIAGSGRSSGGGISYPWQYSWASLVAHLVKNPPAMWETWVGKIPWRRERAPTPVLWPGEFHLALLVLPWWLRQQGICLQFGRPGFDPWVRKIPWRRERLPTPVLLSGKFHGERRLEGCSPWSHRESDTTEWLHSLSFTLLCLGDPLLCQGDDEKIIWRMTIASLHWADGPLIFSSPYSITCRVGTLVSIPQMRDLRFNC